MSEHDDLIREAREAMALWDGDNELSDAYLGMKMRQHLGAVVDALESYPSLTVQSWEKALRESGVVEVAEVTAERAWNEGYADALRGARTSRSIPNPYVGNNRREER